MNITKITDDYKNTLISNSSNNEDNNSANIVITIVPCGISLIPLISIMVYTLVKPLIHKK